MKLTLTTWWHFGLSVFSQKSTDVISWTKFVENENEEKTFELDFKIKNVLEIWEFGKHSSMTFQ